MEFVTSQLPTEKSPGSADLTGECYQGVLEKILILYNLIQNEAEVTLPKSFYEGSITVKPKSGKCKQEKQRPIIYYEYRHKYSQQNTNKQNPATYKRDYIPQ